MALLSLALDASRWHRSHLAPSASFPLKNECCISVRGIIVASWTVEGQTINKIILEDFVREAEALPSVEEAEPEAAQ